MTTGEKLAERLKQNFSGPMEKPEIQVLRDMQAFIQFCIENGLSYQLTLSTLAHDVNGILRQEAAFLPKVTGYSRILRDLHSAKTDAELHKDLAGDDKWD